MKQYGGWPNDEEENDTILEYNLGMFGLNVVIYYEAIIVLNNNNDNLDETAIITSKFNTIYSAHTLIAYVVRWSYAILLFSETTRITKIILL